MQKFLNKFFSSDLNIILFIVIIILSSLIIGFEGISVKQWELGFQESSSAFAGKLIVIFFLVLIFFIRNINIFMEYIDKIYLLFISREKVFCKKSVRSKRKSKKVMKRYIKWRFFYFYRPKKIRNIFYRKYVTNGKVDWENLSEDVKEKFKEKGIGKKEFGFHFNTFQIDDEEKVVNSLTYTQRGNEVKGIKPILLGDNKKVTDQYGVKRDNILGKLDNEDSILNADKFFNQIKENERLEKSIGKEMLKKGEEILGVKKGKKNDWENIKKVWKDWENKGIDD